MLGDIKKIVPGGIAIVWQCQIQISTLLHLAAINFRKLLLELQPQLLLGPASEKPGLGAVPQASGLGFPHHVTGERQE